MPRKSLPDFDVAVIGGGASGLYTAWRMLLEGNQHSAKLKKWKKERGKLRIAVFEGSKRIGGRLLSAIPPGLPNTVCEIGGMRYLSSQPLVRSLVENKFNLPRHEQTVGDPHNLMLLRGKQLRVGDLSNPNKLPYTLTDEEEAWLRQDVTPANTADNLLGFAIKKIFPAIDRYTGPGLRTWLYKQKVDGMELHKHGFWNLIARQLSHEAYRLAVTTVGYDCLGFNTNAVDAICEYLDFTPDTKYFLFDNGFDSLLWTIQQEFEAAGGEVITEKWLESFDAAKLEDGSRGVALQFKGERKPKTARAVVLGMPRRSLELLAQKGPVLDPVRAPHVRYLMAAVKPIHLYKMFVAYDEPWWENLGVSKGRSLTDIPIRQCYYWGVDGRQKGADPNNNNGILMAYNDAISSDFWSGLRAPKTGAGDAAEKPAVPKFVRKKMPFDMPMRGVQNPWAKRLHDNWKMSEAPKAMVAEMHRQLKMLHNVKVAPEPLEAAFVDWGDDPFGGAVHFWNPGYKSVDVVEAMIQPVANFPCYISGEAYSTHQTWVEGALQTAELVLRKFNIPEPAWLTQNLKP